MHKCEHGIGRKKCSCFSVCAAYIQSIFYYVAIANFLPQGFLKKCIKALSSFIVFFTWLICQLTYSLCDHYQDDDGDNAFHIAADAAKYIRECLECIVVMLQYPGAAIEVRNHRQVLAH
jgi:hypothetical protein